MVGIITCKCADTCRMNNQSTPHIVLALPFAKRRSNNASTTVTKIPITTTTTTTTLNCVHDTSNTMRFLEYTHKCFTNASLSTLRYFLRTRDTTTTTISDNWQLQFRIITHDGRISNTWQNLDKHAVTRKPIDDGPSTSPHHSTLIICQPTTQNVATNG